MHLRARVFSVLAASSAALAILAGCSGGGSSAVSPQTQIAPSGSQKSTAAIITVQHVDRAAAAKVATKVVDASAYYAPVKGQLPKTIAKRPQPAGNARQIRSGGPYDLVYYGGPTMTSAQSYDLYVNCDSTCWGGTDPGAFLVNYGASDMIHTVDQYVNTGGPNRYTYGGGITTYYNTSTTLQDQDIYNIVYSAAAVYGTGYGKMYHVFLQSGVSQCSQSAGGCYGSTYCAYHGNVTFGDIGHVIYSVEPYQGISGCADGGTLVDSTASTLSHELTEAITDPDIPQNLAWYSYGYGGEIGDICRFGHFGNVVLNGTNYYIQQEYSNAASACVFGPSWYTIQGNGVAIGVGSNNQVWLLGENQLGPPGNYGIWKWNGSGWDAKPGYANQIAVSPEGTPWVVTNNAAHNISRWNGSGWDVLPGGAIQIGVGSNNTAYILGLNSYGNGNYGIYRWNGSGWSGMPGYAASIAVSPEGTPWITTNDANHTISYWNGSSWVAVTGGAIHVGVGSGNAVVVLGLNYQGPPLDTGIWRWNNPGWTALPSYASSIAVSPEGTPWILTAPSGAISYYR